MVEGSGLARLMETFAEDDDDVGDSEVSTMWGAAGLDPLDGRSQALPRYILDALSTTILYDDDFGWPCDWPLYRLGKKKYLSIYLYFYISIYLYIFF